MPTSSEFIAAAKRDAKIVDALNRAIYSMILLNGVAVDIAGVKGTLNFDHEISSMKGALRLLNIDPDVPLPEPIRRRRGDRTAG